MPRISTTHASSLASEKLPYRANVAALLRVGDGHMFVACERSSGEGWQTVQGGVEPGDASMEDALLREVNEELGIERRDLHIEVRSRVWRRYRFPPNMLARAHNRHQGQEQLWFVARIPSLESIHLEKSGGEFRAVKSVSAAELVQLYVHWKRAVVADFCRELGLLPAI